MARRIANLVLLTIAGWGLNLQLEAQKPSGNFRFWAYRTGDANWADIRFEAKAGEIDTLTLGKIVKGRVHNYEGSPQLTFFRETTTGSPASTIRVDRKPVASIKIPPGVTEAMLIFSPNRTATSTEFAITLIEADMARFPPNSIRILNRTGARLAGKIGTNSQYFNEGISGAFDFSNYLEDGVPVTFLVETEEGPKFVFDKQLQYATDRRVILMLQPPRRKGSYKIQVTNLIEKIDDH